MMLICFEGSFCIFFCGTVEILKNMKNKKRIYE